MKLSAIENNLILVQVGSLFEPFRYFSVSAADAKRISTDFNFFVFHGNRQNPIESAEELNMRLNKTEQITTFYNGIEFRVYRDGPFVRRLIAPTEVVDFIAAS